MASLNQEYYSYCKFSSNKILNGSRLSVTGGQAFLWVNSFAAMTAFHAAASDGKSDVGVRLRRGFVGEEFGFETAYAFKASVPSCFHQRHRPLPDPVQLAIEH
jgi:hypothetical protein